MIYRSSDLLTEPEGTTFKSFGGQTWKDYSPKHGINYGTVEENAACQAVADAKADEIIDLLEFPVSTYTVTLKNRYDFKHYQRVYFSGFDDQIPCGTDNMMRIVEIEYSLNSISDGANTVTLTLSEIDLLANTRRFETMMDEIQRNYKDTKTAIGRGNTKSKIGVAISTTDDGTFANVQLRSSGSIVKMKAWGYRVDLT